MNANRKAGWFVAAAAALAVTSWCAGAALAGGVPAAAGALAAVGSTDAPGGPTYNLVERLWYSQGHTHPIVVHMPIGLLMAAALAVVARAVSKRVTLGVIYFCLAVGAAGAVLSTLAGWAWAPQLKPGWDSFDSGSPFFWHRWGGVVITVAAIGLFVWATVALRKPDGKQWPWQVGVLAVTFGMGWVGHEGGELVYEDNAKKIIGIATGDRKPKFQRKEVLEPGETAVPAIAKTPAVPATPAAGTMPGATQSAAAAGSTTQPAAGATASGAATPPAAGGAVVAAGSVDFAKQLWPVFEAKCVYCHGADEDKGGYRMHTREAALKPGDAGAPPILPGNAKGSPFVKHITGENTDDFALMPPKKEKKPVTPEEIELVKKWIDEGATWNR